MDFRVVPGGDKVMWRDGDGVDSLVFFFVFDSGKRDNFFFFKSEGFAIPLEIYLVVELMCCAFRLITIIVEM